MMQLLGQSIREFEQPGDVRPLLFISRMLDGYLAAHFGLPLERPQ
jgi:hypothetical protein